MPNQLIRRSKCTPANPANPEYILEFEKRSYRT
jgi:hypothetical protein